MNSKRIFHGLLAGLIGVGLLEVVTGLALLPFYSPGATSAYPSTKSIESSALLGFIEGLHHWLSAILIVFGCITVLFGLATAAYRLSSKKLWVGSVVLVLFFLLLQLTGHILPWDTHAVRTATVETGIAQGAPLIGDLQANFLRSGKEVGPNTLTLWFWAHVAILSIISIFLGVLLLKKVRALGWSKKAAVGTAVLMFLAAVVLAFAARVQLGATATSADFGSFDAKPEWYILPMHTLLGLAQGIKPSLAFVGSMVIPGVFVALILFAPWLDKRAKADNKSVYGPLLGSVLLVGGGVLFFMSAADMASPNGPNLPTAATASSGVALVLDPKLVALGQQAIKQAGCTDCHTIHGSGGKGGPVLDGTGTRHPDIAWQIKHIMNPKSVTPSSTMPSFPSLGTENTKAVAEYLVSLK